MPRAAEANELPMTDAPKDNTAKTKTTTVPVDGAADVGKTTANNGDKTVAEPEKGKDDWNKGAAIDAWSLPTATPKVQDAKPADKPVDVAQKAADKTPQEKPAEKPADKPVELAGNPYRFGGLEQAIKVADTTNPNREMNRILEGQLDGLNLLETITKPGEPKDGVNSLEKVLGAIEIQKENHYLQYLSPATSRADLAVAKISSGDAKLVAEGERGLLEAVKMRPDLQFNPQFQESVQNAYKTMAEARVRAGLPPLESTAKSGDVPATARGAGSPYDLLRQANESYGKTGWSPETARKFEAAKTAADSQDFNQIDKDRLAMFSHNLELTRKISEMDARGQDASKEREAVTSLQDKQLQNYQDYLAPGAIRTNTALAMIASGKPDALTDAKKLLADAVNARPELEFSTDYQNHVRDAFKTHHENLRLANSTTDGGAPGDPAKPGQPTDFNPNYKPTDARQLGGKVPQIDDDKQIDSYLADTITGPALAAGLLYLGYRQGKYQINRVREYLQARREGRAVEAGGSEGKVDTARSDTSGRPERELNSGRNLTRTEVQTAGDGTRKIVDGQVEMAGMSWRERLTDPEIKELDARRTALEERAKKETLKAEESKELDSLRYFDKHRNDPAVHKQMIERMAEARPEGGFTEKSLRTGGFRLRNSAAPIVGAAILVVAVMEAQAAGAQTPTEPLKRAKYGQ